MSNREQLKAIDNVYVALDNLMELLPGWGRLILRASEPMFQTLDSIEQTIGDRTNERRTDDTTGASYSFERDATETKASTSKTEASRYLRDLDNSPYFNSRQPRAY